MVNGVSGYGNNAYGFYRAAAGIAVNHGNDVENMVRFVNGQPVTTTADPTIAQTVVGTLPFLGLFGGIQGGIALKNHGWSLKNTIADVNRASAYTARSQAIQAGKETILNNYGNIFKKSVPVSAKRNFLGRILDKIPGYTKLRATGIGQAMGKSNAGWMAVIEGGMELVTNVIPTFQTLGAGAGFKQIGKSAVKVGAGAVGWVAGDAVGKGIGAAIGTAICPGIGTAIGTFVGGFLGGIIGSAVAGKAAKAITGKSELEKANDKQIAQVSQQIDADPQNKVALAQQTLQQAEEILAQDPNNKDALAAKASAEAVLAQAAQNPAQDATTQQYPQMPQGQMPTTIPGVFPGVPVVPGFNGISYDMNVYNQAMSTVSMMNTTPYQANPFMTNPYMATPYMTMANPYMNYNQPQQAQ